MHSHDTSTTVVVGGTGELARDEVLLLDQITANLGPCPTCSAEGVFLTFWTPSRTVHVIVCGVCGTERWKSPTGRTS